MEPAIKRMLQVQVLKMRVGTWIALCLIVGGAVLSVRHVTLGAAFVIFGILIISLIGKRQDPKTGDGEDAAPR